MADAADVVGSPVPMAVVSHDAGIPMSLQQVAWELEGEPEETTSGVEGLLVPNGLGSLQGWTVMEQVAHAVQTDHPHRHLPQLQSPIREAVEFECEHTVEAIDAERESMVLKCIWYHSKMTMEKSEWDLGAPMEIAEPVARIHGPLMGLLLDQTSMSSSERILEHCQQGFPYVGELPPCEGQSSPFTFPKEMDVCDLRSDRIALNSAVKAALKDLPFSEDILPQTLEDAQEGFMTQPRLLEPGDLEKASYTRRIPVREERAKGWRTRVVDHKTESGINPATVPVDKISHDTIEV